MYTKPDVAALGLLLVSVCMASVSLASSIIKMDQETIDLGVLEQEVQDVNIPVCNVGDAPLRIRFKAASCNCITGGKYDPEIPPGGRGTIMVRVHAKEEMRGASEQKLLFETNDPKRPILLLTLRYRMKLPEVEVSPRQLAVELSKADIQTKKLVPVGRVTIVDRWTGDLTVSHIQSSPNIKIWFYDIHYVCPQGMRSHLMFFDAKVSPEGTLDPSAQWFSFKTNHPGCLEVRIPIAVTVLSNISVRPKIVIFRRGEAERRTVNIVSADRGQALRIERIYCEQPWVHVQREAVDAWTEKCLLTVDRALIKSDQPRGVQKAQVVVEVSQPDVAKEIIEVLLL